MTGYFITGAGTDVGKTFVACGLVRRLKARAIKPVASGFDAENLAASDAGALLAAMGHAITPEAIAAICPWRFAAALSPDMAAACEGKAIDFAAVVEFSKHVAPGETLLVEGVGGVMVPLDHRHTTLDWMTALGFPVILVGGSYLGALSHTLSAFEVLRSRGLKTVAIVTSESPDSPVSLDETVRSIAKFTAPLTPVKLPRASELQDAAFERLVDVLAG